MWKEDVNRTTFLEINRRPQRRLRPPTPFHFPYNNYIAKKSIPTTPQHPNDVSYEAMSPSHRDALNLKLFIGIQLSMSVI